MTIENIHSGEWNSVKEAENNFLSAKHYFRKSHGFFEEILLIIRNISEQGTVLRFIRDEDFDDSHLEILIPIIIDIAVDGNIDNFSFARDILIKNSKNSAIRNSLTSIFDELISSRDEYIYRRVAELLVFLNYNDLRKKLMDECKRDNNNDIKEIYADFINKYNIS
ncbi:hypothetical protein D5073_21780 [Pectobacterium versatile]|uniref:hypothetical protein n=1 Tax=Pectobacterium versatile TaxID=2488639 RepID=UPI000B7BFA68|nr:hypothetical protein [Pectobacterium versatile]ASN83545.1 Hypothetical protein SCC1_0057 [Pectobacterium versatile]MBQ4765456.1 hypothetical protein [Pectobacterium versatile]POY57775.1 hypothetical protein PB70LOC_03138 [Pectobacterium versatile]POY61928.1 hypothetical protein PB69LOC_03377 [Pectobacterium versatile]RJL46856.1 hypothetical protein D5073_21780 [Pectobacterium versatile]